MIRVSTVDRAGTIMLGTQGVPAEQQDMANAASAAALLTSFNAKPIPWSVWCETPPCLPVSPRSGTFQLSEYATTTWNAIVAMAEADYQG